MGTLADTRAGYFPEAPILLWSSETDPKSSGDPVCPRRIAAVVRVNDVEARCETYLDPLPHLHCQPDAKMKSAVGRVAIGAKNVELYVTRMTNEGEAAEHVRMPCHSAE